MMDQNTSCASLFYTLLKKRSFPSDSAEFRLLRSDEKKRSELENLAMDFECQIAWYPHAVYLIPNIGNNFLTYSRDNMRQKFGSDKNSALLSLRYFTILVLLLCFYDTQTSNQKIRSFISLDELMQEIERRLKEASENQQSSDTDKRTFTNLYKAYQNLSGEDNKAQTSKKGVIKKVLTFLEKEGLILWDESSAQIRTLSMLDDKVDFMLRNDSFQTLFDQLKGGDIHAVSE